VLKELDDLGIPVPQNVRFYPHFILIFDAETWLKETTQSSRVVLYFSCKLSGYERIVGLGFVPFDRFDTFRL